jgi:hypothetical protein
MSTPGPVALTYNGFVQNLGNLAVVTTQTVGGIVQGTDVGFQTVLPQALNYGELRIQRDLDLNALTTSNSYALISGNNTLSISPNDFVTLQTISILIGGAPTPLLPVSKEFILNCWGNPTFLAPPQYFAPYGGDMATGGNTSSIFLLGPTPDQAYPVSVTGTIRMPSLNQNSTDPTLASTATTWISTNLPDLLLQAAAIIIAQYQRNFGATSNDPQMPGTYESNYQALLKGAIVENQRAKFFASAWSSQAPATIATPSRGQ